MLQVLAREMPTLKRRLKEEVGFDPTADQVSANRPTAPPPPPAHRPTGPPIHDPLIRSLSRASRRP